MSHKQKQKIVHFVCSGNVFRSRLAEAYFKKQNLGGWTANSSGIYAKAGWFGPISPWAQAIAEHNDLKQYLTENWRQTTCVMLQESDLVIFMQNVHEKWTAHHCDISKITFQTWDIEDRGVHRLEQDFIKDSETADKADRTYINDKIERSVTELVDSIKNNALLQ